MPADDTLAARSHARISASPASRAATQNLAHFTGTLYPPIGGPRHDADVHARGPRWVKLCRLRISAARLLYPGEFNRSVQHQLQSIGRGFEGQGLSRALIEPQSNAIEVGLGEAREIGSSREVLSQQAVGEPLQRPVMMVARFYRAYVGARPSGDSDVHLQDRGVVHEPVDGRQYVRTFFDSIGQTLPI